MKAAGRLDRDQRVQEALTARMAQFSPTDFRKALSSLKGD